MAEALGLRALEERFLAVITGRDDAATNLARLGLAPAEAGGWVVDDERAPALERLEVYTDMYFLRLRDALLEDFPKLGAVLGEGDFHDLVVDYLAAHPPDSASLRELGARLPGFLAGHALGRARPWLPDLAALEWARADVFDRADARPLTLGELRALPPERFAGLPLSPVPAHAVCAVAAGVDEVWRRIEDGAPAGEPSPGASILLVWRQGVVVLHRRVESEEGEVLGMVLAGTTFGALCERLAEGRTPEAAARAAFEILGRWIAGELVVAREES
jgi:hypothetical protein